MTTEKAHGSVEVGGMMAGRYRVERKLGEGGMGAVYQAHDEQLGESVAIKVLLLGDNPASELLERFRKEVKLTRRITHRHVARVHDLTNADGLWFLTMELIEGVTLAKRIAEHKKLPSTEVMGLGAMMFHGLAAAHGAGVIHRDLKLNNIMLDRHGRLVVLDFGVACAVDVVTNQGLTGTSSGTPMFMSPEQLAGDPVTPQSDIYSAGLVLHALVTGKLPYDGGNTQAMVNARLVREGPDPSSLDGVETALAEVIIHCLQREAGDRPTSSESLAARLESTVDNASTVFRGSTKNAPEVDRAELNTVKVSRAPKSDAQALWVAPLKMRGGGDDELAEMVTEQLVDLLSRTAGLKVVAAGSSQRSTTNSGQRSVEGTLTLQGTSVRASVRLVGADGVQLWSERLEQHPSPFGLDMAESLALRIAEEVRAELPSWEREIPPAARQDYAHGRKQYRRYMLHGDDGAHAVLSRALSAAPEFGPARAWVAIASVRRWFMYSQETRSEEETRSAVKDALDAAPNVPETHVAVAALANTLGDFEGMVRALRKALDLAPTQPDARELQGQFELETGRTDVGLKSVAAALATAPELVVAPAQALRQFALDKKWDEAETLLRALDQSGTSGPALLTARMRLAAWRGDTNAMLKLRDDIVDVGPGHLMRTYLDCFQGKVSAQEIDVAVRKILDSSTSLRTRTALQQAAVEAFAHCGAVDRALDFVEQATGEALVDIEWLRKCAPLQPLRSHPRFEAAYQKVAARAALAWQSGSVGSGLNTRSS